MARCLLFHRIYFPAFPSLRAFLSTLPSPSLPPPAPVSLSLLSSSACTPPRAPLAAAYRTAPTARFDSVPLRLSSRNFSSRWPNYRSAIVHRDARALLQIMQQREWDAALEQQLTHADVALTPHIVDQVVACIPGAKLALQFFIWAGEQIGYPPPTSQAAYNVLEWYTRKPKIIHFLRILRCLEDRRFYLSPSRANVLLQGYGWAGMLDRAYTVMLQEQGFSNDMLVNCFLSAIVKQYRYNMAYDVYMEMKKWGTPLELCYDALILGISLAGSERWQEADQLYETMMDAGQVPSEATCNALVLTISKAGEHKRAYTLLQNMIQRKVKLECATLSAVVECLCHAKQLQRASRLIEQGRQCGCVIHPHVYKSFSGVL